MEHKALYQTGSQAAETARQPGDCLNWVSTVHTQAFTRHIRLAQDFG
jgi:hypothetical protein